MNILNNIFGNIVGNCELVIMDGNKVYKPQIIEGVSLEIERRGTPSKLKFDVLKDDLIKITEGNQVSFKWKGNNVFYGFVFSTSYDKSDVISVTAYDQLRYLKNKYTYVYKNKTASELIKMIANDFNLKTGDIVDSAYKLSRTEDAQTLFDIINNALDLTLIQQKVLYVLYDDFGKLTLKNLESMKTDVVVGDYNSGDYEYTISIDEETYNRIKLYFDNSASGKRDVYQVEDSNNIKKWGVLQMYEKLDDGEDGKSKAEKLLQLHNAPTKTLTIKEIEGDTRVRGGTLLTVNLMAGITNIQTQMVVESVTHNFLLDEHKMDVTVRGRKTNE